MTLSRRLFRLWLILAGLWVAYIVVRALLFVMWLAEGEPMLFPTHILMTTQWAVHWALIPPVVLLLGGCLVLWVCRHVRSL
jgi:hypothetical protein